MYSTAQVASIRTRRITNDAAFTTPLWMVLQKGGFAAIPRMGSVQCGNAGLAAGTRPFEGEIASVNGKLHGDDQAKTQNENCPITKHLDAAYASIASTGTVGLVWKNTLCRGNDGNTLSRMRYKATRPRQELMAVQCSRAHIPHVRSCKATPCPVSAWLSDSLLHLVFAAVLVISNVQ
jgi:hypothetical protein